MNRPCTISCLLSLGLIAVFAACDQTNQPATTDSPRQPAGFMKHAAAPVEGSWVVVLKDNVPADSVAPIASQLSIRGNGRLKKLYRNALRGFSVELSEANAIALTSDPRVKLVEQDFAVSAGPKGTPKEKKHDKQIISWSVTRVGGTHDGTGGVAWIVDSGIDLDNPDLNIDLARSRDFITAAGNNPNDEDGHGTHVAGIIGARNNTIGTVGVAANATLISVRVLDAKGVGPISAVIAGLDYVASVALPDHVVNVSITAAPSPSLDEAVRRLARRGVRVVIAAGNDAVHSLSVSPARVDTANVYTVSAIDPENVIADFSNFGNPAIDYAAPGVEVVSTGRKKKTMVMSGTSMAAPHVAGLLLLGRMNPDGIALGDFDGFPDPIAHY